MIDCAFCTIANNLKSEAYRIIDNGADRIVMLVSHPETKGHFIVFPNKHFSEMNEMENIGRFWEEVINLAEQLTRELGAKAYTLKLNNRLYKLENDRLHVGHVHVHVIPRYVKDEIRTSSPVAANKKGLAIIKRSFSL